jgi:hypothetical protein
MSFPRWRCLISADKLIPVEKIKAVLFDLDDTLRVNDPHPHDVFTKYVRALGFQLSEEDKKTPFSGGTAIGQIPQLFWTITKNTMAMKILSGKTTCGAI